MDIRPIETEEEHRAALQEIEALWGAADGTPEGDRLQALAMLVAAYEERRWPVEESVTEEASAQANVAQRLIELGGSDPTATAAPRSRFW
jgi:antitoxin component HigA of HigAB toxin-antitoxin module